MESFLKLSFRKWWIAGLAPLKQVLGEEAGRKGAIGLVFWGLLWLVVVLLLSASPIL